MQSGTPHDGTRTVPPSAMVEDTLQETHGLTQPPYFDTSDSRPVRFLHAPFDRRTTTRPSSRFTADERRRHHVDAPATRRARGLTPLKQLDVDLLAPPATSPPTCWEDGGLAPRLTARLFRVSPSPLSIDEEGVPARRQVPRLPRELWALHARPPKSIKPAVERPHRCDSDELQTYSVDAHSHCIHNLCPFRAQYDRAVLGLLEAKRRVKFDLAKSVVTRHCDPRRGLLKERSIRNPRRPRSPGA